MLEVKDISKTQSLIKPKIILKQNKGRLYFYKEDTEDLYLYYGGSKSIYVPKYNLRISEDVLKTGVELKLGLEKSNKFYKEEKKNDWEKWNEIIWSPLF